MLKFKNFKLIKFEKDLFKYLILFLFNDKYSKLFKKFNEKGIYCNKF